MGNLGMQLGIKVGASLRSVLGSMFKPAKSGLVIAHSIVGRRRYTTEVLKGQSAETCALIEKAICKVEYVTSCKVNPITGSLVVTYTCDESTASAFFEGVSHTLTGMHAQHEKSIIPTSLISASYQLNDQARALRDQMRNFLNHSEPLFISRLVGLSFLGYGLFCMLYRGDRPSGIQVFWWGMALLLRRSHRDAPATGSSAPSGSNTNTPIL